MSKPKYKLSPPHGDLLYWQSVRHVDSRVEEVTCSRDWFWRGMNSETESKAG